MRSPRSFLDCVWETLYMISLSAGFIYTCFYNQNMCVCLVVVFVYAYIYIYIHTSLLGSVAEVTYTAFMYRQTNRMQAAKGSENRLPPKP